jgi:hypothetical protein
MISNLSGIGRVSHAPDPALPGARSGPTVLRMALGA